MAIRIMDKANRFLEEQGITETKKVLSKLALPILENSSLDFNPQDTCKK